MLDELPTIIRVRDEKNNRFVDFDIKNKSISILKSWSFANPTPNTVYSTTSGFVIYISDPNPDWGMGSGSQTITAGSTNFTSSNNVLSNGWVFKFIFFRPVIPN